MRVLFSLAPLVGVVACAASTPVARGSAAPPTTTGPNVPPDVGPEPSGAPQTTLALDASPRADMSTRLGGLRLGMTVEDFVATCEKAAGFVVRVGAADHLGCSVAPEPLRASGRVSAKLAGQVLGTFCGPEARLCEIGYAVTGEVSERDNQLAAIIDMLVERYGPPMVVEGYRGGDPMATCLRNGTVHSARAWVFGPAQAPPHPGGLVRVRFDCNLSSRDSPHSLTLHYDDEIGFRRRRGELRERREND